MAFAAAQRKWKYRREGKGHIVVTFINSSGLGVLALAGRDLDRAAVRLVAINQRVIRPVALMGLDQTLTLCTSLAEALAGP